MKIAITGTPGTGKTEVAEMLAERLGWKLIKLNELAEEKNLYSGFDKKRNCKIVDLKRLTKEVEKVKEDVIIESHYSHELPCDAIIVLTCEPRELRVRLETKEWSRKKIEENIEAEIMEVCKSEALEKKVKVFEVDTTEKEPEEVAGEIEEKIKRLKK